MKKRIFSILLAVVMIVSIMPFGASAANLLWPVPGHTNLSQGYHGGNAIDISDGSIAGANIVAAIGGQVTHVFTCGEQHYGSEHNCHGFGTGVAIRGDDGRAYQYAHMMAGSIPGDVYVGARVERGQLIGKVGQTGNATGYHLHFGISYTGNYWEAGPDPSTLAYDYDNVPVTVGVEFRDTKVTSVGDYTADLHSEPHFTNATGANVSSVGIDIYDVNGTWLGGKSEAPANDTRNLTWMYINYEIGSGREINLALDSGTTYQYRFYVVINGTRYDDSMRTFTTSGGCMLDVNGILDGESSPNLGSYGTFDVYINGSLAANDVSDYCDRGLANGTTYQISDIRAQAGYRYEGVSSGALSGTLRSNTVVVLKLAKEPFALTSQPTSVSTTAGKTATFKVAANGSNLTYQWQYKTPSGSWTDSPASGNQTATLSVPATVGRNGYQYRCIVKNGSQTLTSNAAKLSVFGIKTQPKSVSTKTDTAVNFKVAATGSKLTYQWQYKAPGGTWKDSPATGNQTATLSVPATVSRNGYQYRCIVKNGSSSVTSKAATLTVFGIKTQPKNVSATIGKTATFKVVATGSNLTYQWQYRKPGGSWTNSTMNSAKSATLKVPATAGRNGYQFRCIVKSGSYKIITNAVKLTAFGIKTQPTNVTAKVGNTATFKVVATGANLTYQWQYKAPGGTWKNSVSTGNQTAALKVPATAGRNGYQFRCIVKSGSNSVTSNVVKLTVKK